jgi:hypothetical protein
VSDLQKDTKSSVRSGVALGQAMDWPGEQEWTIGSEEQRRRVESNTASECRQADSEEVVDGNLEVGVKWRGRAGVMMDGPDV